MASIIIITKEKPTQKIISEYMEPYKSVKLEKRSIIYTKKEIIEREKRNIKKHSGYIIQAYNYCINHPFKSKFKFSKKCIQDIKDDYKKYNSLLSLSDGEIFKRATENLKRLSEVKDNYKYAVIDEKGNMLSYDKPNTFWNSYSSERTFEFFLKDNSRNNKAKVIDIKKIDELTASDVKEKIFDPFQKYTKDKMYKEFLINGTMDYTAEEFRILYPTLEDYLYKEITYSHLVITPDGKLHCSTKNPFYPETFEETKKWYDNFEKEYLEKYKDCYITNIVWND